MFRERLRVSTGCHRCRQRRKKCDEQKPSCGPCRRSDAICIWPEAVQSGRSLVVRHTRAVEHTRQQSAEQGPRPNTHRAIQPRQLRRSQDYRLRDWERQSQGRVQAGHHRADQSRDDSSTDSDLIEGQEGVLQSAYLPPRMPDGASRILSAFCTRVLMNKAIQPCNAWWEQVVPYVATTEESVLYALDSLGSTVTPSILSRDDTGTSSPEALRASEIYSRAQYSRSIQMLGKRGARRFGYESVMLICAIIYSTVSHLRCSAEESLTHFVWIQRLIDAHMTDVEVQQRSFLTPAMLKTLVLPAYYRIRRNLITIGHLRPEKFPFRIQQDPSNDPSSEEILEFMVRTVLQIDDDTLIEFMLASGSELILPANLYSADSRQLPPVKLSKLRDWAADVSDWKKVFVMFEANEKAKPLAQNIVVRLVCRALHIMLDMISIRLHFMACPRETAYDTLLDRFERINATAEAALSEMYTPRQPSHSSIHPLLEQFPGEFLYPLWITAVKCRDRVVRREAITLLEIWPISEGLISGPVAALAARTIFQREDPIGSAGAAAGDSDDTRHLDCIIPEEQRVRACRYFFKEKKLAGGGDLHVTILGSRGEVSTLNAQSTPDTIDISRRFPSSLSTVLGHQNSDEYV